MLMRVCGWNFLGSGAMSKGIVNVASGIDADSNMLYVNFKIVRSLESLLDFGCQMRQRV